MRFTFLLFALAVVQTAVWPAPAVAATPSGCAAYLDTLAKDLKTNTTVVDDLSRPYDPSPDHVVQSAAAYNKYADSFALCPKSKAPYRDALLGAWKAWLEHATNHTNPIDTAQLAAQKLQKCTVTYSGTDDGTTCAAWLQQVTAWQSEWSSP